MASSPTYDPDELVGRERGNNYMKLLNDRRRPLFNRAVMASYPPGSTFKTVNGLIGLQEGVLVPSQTYPCHGGYPYGRGVKCHNHWSPIDLMGAVQTSCNAYFCYVFRNIIENRKYGNIQQGLDVWDDYVRSFGFGRKLGSDFHRRVERQCADLVFLRQGLPWTLERPDGYFAGDRAGRVGLHAAADGQFRRYHREPGIITKFPMWSSAFTTGFDRRPVL